MELKPIDLLNKTFSHKMRGLDPAEVREYLSEAAGEIERLLTENESLRSKMAGLESEVRRYREMEDTLNNALVLAQKTADQLNETARKEAEIMVSEARQTAERDLRELRGEYEELLKTKDRFQIEFRALLRGCLEMCERGDSAERTDHPAGE